MPANKIQLAEQQERDRVGATIRTIREMRGFTPDEFANEVGISRPYLANIEAGRKPLTQVLLARIAKKLDVRQVAIIRDGYFAAEEQAS